MATPFFDDAAKSLFDEILLESVEEFREEKAKRLTETTAALPEKGPEKAPTKPLKSPPKESRADTRATPEERLHRAVFVLTMHKGRRHADEIKFRRRWLEEVLRATVLLLAELPEPEDDTT